MKEITLRGITWDHSRALPPLVATAQRFEEQHAGIRIQWQKRTLHEFGHADLSTLAERFDLLVVDHPMAGDAEATGKLVNLLPLISADQLADLRNDAMGPSFSSYEYHDKLYALPIDAAAPAASMRPDLFELHAIEEPRLWTDLLALARRGQVRMPGFSADLFLNFMGLCVSCGSSVATNAEKLVHPEIGIKCLDLLAELAALMPDLIYRMNPIAIYEAMAAGDDFLYCPFAYTYSNYSREGFAVNRLRFANPVALKPGTPMRSVLGGTGIAISSRCEFAAQALEYGLFVAGCLCQSTLYGVCGGQPARRSAWNDPFLNQLTDGFFTSTAKSIETAYVRPRYPGYVILQERAGEVLQEYCKQRGNPKTALEQINDLYRSTLKAQL